MHPCQTKVLVLVNLVIVIFFILDLVGLEIKFLVFITFRIHRLIFPFSFASVFVFFSTSLTSSTSATASIPSSTAS